MKFVRFGQVKMGIPYIRGNLTEKLWHLTYNEFHVLEEVNWTTAVRSELQHFEHDILDSMKAHGWDGNEDLKKMQWTFFGALFYSIIVITTIGMCFIQNNLFLISTISI